MYNSVPPQLWMQLDKKVRNHLVGIFKIPRTGITEIYNEEVRADGYSVDDLKAISLDKMIVYIGSEQSFPSAWEMTCKKANEEIFPSVKEVIFPMADEPREEEPVVKQEEIINIIEKTNDTKKSK